MRGSLSGFRVIDSAPPIRDKASGTEIQRQTNFGGVRSEPVGSRQNNNRLILPKYGSLFLHRSGQQFRVPLVAPAIRSPLMELHPLSGSGRGGEARTPEDGRRALACPYD